MPISHHEVLLRMIGEDGEIVPPMSFIPVAERYDLMPEIDFWVVENFLRYCAQKRRQSSLGRYTINLSGASINKPKFVDGLEEMLRRSSVPCEVILF
ncbi:MAG: EAL domain-containing protein [Synechococcales cyanobacterium RU_4_20]|nr:EAL domain-containing protein [Synechococcales cyanobacterium RU_4_20]